MTNKITLNDLKMAEHLLEENCVKLVEFWSEHSSRAGIFKSFSQIETYHIERFLIFAQIE
jgi:hypothetical protein